MSDLSEQQAALTVKVTGSDSTGVETNYRIVDSNGSAKNTLNDPTSGAGITSSSNGTAANQLLHTQSPDTITATIALGALNATVSISMAGLASVGFQILAGTLIGTITPQCSIDGGTTWASASFYDSSNSTIVNSVTFASANTQKILSVLPVGGSSNVRVIVTAYTSGTANTLMRASEVSAAAGAVTAAAFGTAGLTYPVTIANTAVLLLAANVNRKYAMISSPSTTLQIQLGSSTGLTNSTGFTIASGGFFELKGDSLYTGPIYGIASSAKTIAVTEGTP